MLKEKFHGELLIFSFEFSQFKYISKYTNNLRIIKFFIVDDDGD